jgi:hypothetical protein
MTQPLLHSVGESFRMPNDPQGRRALIKKLQGFDIARNRVRGDGGLPRLYP